MSSYSQAREKRAAFYRSQLQQVDERASAVRGELADALLALALAQDTVDSLRCDLECLESYGTQLRSSLESASRMDPAVMRMLPTDILRLIFLEVGIRKAEPGGLWEGWDRICEYDRSRAISPWILAAVSRRWRAIALSMPDLWTYVGLDGFTKEKNGIDHPLASPAVQYLETVFERSGDLPLDISVEWEYVTWDPIEHNALIDLVAGVAGRWRSLLLALPNDEVTPERMDMFRLRTPLLEELVACMEDDSVGNPWYPDFPDYLPFCPKLKMMRTDGCHVLWSTPRIHHSGLCHLELEVDIPPRVLWDILRSSPNLERLYLDVPHEPRDWMGSAPDLLCMPHLRHFEPRFRGVALLSTWPDLIQFPALTSLSLRLTPWDDLAALSPAARTRITFLEIYADSLYAIDCETLQTFTAVRDLSITGSCSGCFFDQVNTSSMWLRLEEIVLRDATLDAPTADALLSLLRARRQLPLKNVRFEDCDAPEWLEQHVGSILLPATGAETQ